MKAGTPWNVLNPQKRAWDGSLGESGDLHFYERSVSSLYRVYRSVKRKRQYYAEITDSRVLSHRRGKRRGERVSREQAYERLKYWTARSCCCAACRVWKVPRLRRLPVFAFFLLEYKRYSPVFNFRITVTPGALRNQPLVRRWVFLVRLALTAEL